MLNVSPLCTKKGFKTEQEVFWYGDFGDEYVDRNDGMELLGSKTALFARMLNNKHGIDTMVEFGSNIGLNIFALKRLLPKVAASAIEINEKAASKLREQYVSLFREEIKIYNQSILDFEVDYKRTLSLISGVLIHINPECLKNVYKKLYDSSSKYIIMSEYCSPVPTEVLYRGHSGKLFKRDFAGEILDMYPDLRLADYGFAYHRDKMFPQDDVNWFVLEKIKD